jgi:hypothetical protein
MQKAEGGRGWRRREREGEGGRGWRGREREGEGGRGRKREGGSKMEGWIGQKEKE